MKVKTQKTLFRILFEYKFLFQIKKKKKHLMMANQGAI